MTVGLLKQFEIADEDERRKNVRGEDEELEKESSKGESRESLKSESSSEVEDSSRHDESDVKTMISQKFSFIYFFALQLDLN